MPAARNDSNNERIVRGLQNASKTTERSCHVHFYDFTHDCIKSLTYREKSINIRFNCHIFNCLTVFVNNE